jgi:hypothetical protein
LDCDALQELSELSLDLQERNVFMYIENKKIRTPVQIFGERRKIPGPFMRIQENLSTTFVFRGSHFTRQKANIIQRLIQTLYKNLKTSIEKRLLNNDDVELANWARVLDRDNWPQDVSNHLPFGEN